MAEEFNDKRPSTSGANNGGEIRFMGSGFENATWLQLEKFQFFFEEAISMKEEIEISYFAEIPDDKLDRDPDDPKRPIIKLIRFAVDGEELDVGKIRMEFMDGVKASLKK